MAEWCLIGRHCVWFVGISLFFEKTDAQNRVSIADDGAAVAHIGHRSQLFQSLFGEPFDLVAHTKQIFRRNKYSDWACAAPLFRLMKPNNSVSMASSSSVGHVSNSRWIWYYLKLTCFRICLICWDRKSARVWANMCSWSDRRDSFLSRKIN